MIMSIECKCDCSPNSSHIASECAKVSSSLFLGIYIITWLTYISLESRLNLDIQISTWHTWSSTLEDFWISTDFSRESHSLTTPISSVLNCRLYYVLMIRSLTFDARLFFLFFSTHSGPSYCNCLPANGVLSLSKGNHFLLKFDYATQGKLVIFTRTRYSFEILVKLISEVRWPNSVDCWEVSCFRAVYHF